MFYKLDYNNDSHCIAIAECLLEWCHAADDFNGPEGVDPREVTLWDVIDDLVSCIDDVTLQDAAQVIVNTIGTGPSILPKGD